MPMVDGYREDLAHIRDAGYTALARAAAAALLRALRRQRIDRGLAVDLGCGDGQPLPLLG